MLYTYLQACDIYRFYVHVSSETVVPILPSGRHWSEDHCFQRSLKLHRDEDMIMEKLKSNVNIYMTDYYKIHAYIIHKYVRTYVCTKCTTVYMYMQVRIF